MKPYEYLLYAFYTLTAGFLIFQTDFYFTGDTVAYLNIAQKYSRGSFSEALNGYWSPLISWLLVPGWWLKLSPIISFRIVNFGATILLLYSSNSLSRFFALPTFHRLFAQGMLVLFCLAFQLECHSPDLLSAACFLFFLVALADTSLLSWPKFMVATFLLLFSKGIFLYLTVLFILAYAALDFWQKPQESRQLFILHGKRVAVALSMIALWGFALQYKYGYFTLGSAAAYNEYIKTLNNLTLHYHSFSGLLPPAEPSMIFPMEDPTLYPIDYAQMGSPSWSERKARVVGNIPLLFYLLRWFSWIGLALPFLLCLPFLLGHKKKRYVYVFILFSSALLLVAYLPVFYEERYTLPVYAVWIWCSFYVLHLLLTNIPLPPVGRWLLYSMLAVIFAKNFYTQYTGWQNRKEFNHHVAHTIQELASALPFQGKKVAVNNDSKGFDLPSMLVLQKGGVHYGELSSTASQEKSVGELERYKIDYLFVTGCAQQRCEEGALGDFLLKKEIVYRENYFGLRVYKLR